MNTLGFCIGGTLLASALAVLAARGEQPAASMTLLTTMLDFSDTGDIGLLVTPEGVLAAREAAIGKGGLLKGSELAQVFASLRANDLIWPYVVKGYLKGQAPPAFDLLYWNSDDTNLPGPMFCWYLRNTYLENKLREPGAHHPARRAGRPRRDRRADVRLRVQGRPHRAVEDGLREHAAAVGRRHLRPRRERAHRRCDQPAGQEQAQLLGRPTASATPTPERWFDAAEKVPGSWWPAWYAWLAAHSAVPRSTRRKTPGNAEFTADRGGPGRLRAGEGELTDHERVLRARGRCGRRPAGRPRCPAARAA